MTPLADTYMTLTQTAAALGVHRVTIRRWIRAGRLPAESIGGVVLIDKQTVEQLARQRVLEGAVE